MWRARAGPVSMAFSTRIARPRPLGEAIRDGEDFIGVFRPAGPVDRLVIVQAYASVIESDDGVENFRIAALVDVGGRERAQIEQFESQIRDRDMLMRELQHRVKNNLQLITALIRLEARSAAEGETVALARLASRIDALTVLYRTLSAENAPPEIDLGQYLSNVATIGDGGERHARRGNRHRSRLLPALDQHRDAGGAIDQRDADQRAEICVRRPQRRSAQADLPAGRRRVTVVVSDDGVG